MYSRIGCGSPDRRDYVHQLAVLVDDHAVLGGAAPIAGWSRLRGSAGLSAPGRGNRDGGLTQLCVADSTARDFDSCSPGEVAASAWPLIDAALAAAPDAPNEAAGPKVGPELMPTTASGAQFSAHDAQWLRLMPCVPATNPTLAVWGSGVRVPSAPPGNPALLTDPWVGSAWEGGSMAAEAEHRECDQCRRRPEAERDPGE